MVDNDIQECDIMPAMRNLIGDIFARLRGLRNRIREKPNSALVTDAERPRLVVDQTGQGDFRAIGEAIRAAVVSGTLITVKPGIYREALVIDREVEIVGEGDRAQVVVEATDTDAITVTADRAVVEPDGAGGGDEGEPRRGTRGAWQGCDRGMRPDLGDRGGGVHHGKGQCPGVPRLPDP